MMVPTKIVTPINVILTGLFIRSPLVAGLAFRAHVTHKEAERRDHQRDPPTVVELRRGFGRAGGLAKKRSFMQQRLAQCP
jgi:hypothetical protein